MTVADVAAHAGQSVQAENPDQDKFPDMVGDGIHFSASAKGAFVFPPGLELGAADHASDHIDVSVPHLNQDFAAGVVASSDGGGAMIQAGLFGDAIASHVLHDPLSHMADYFIV